MYLRHRLLKLKNDAKTCLLMANILPLYLKNIILCFYKEQKESVKNLPIKEAILEVNHWCHEKVTYRPSDGRTSVPLAIRHAYLATFYNENQL